MSDSSQFRNRLLMTKMRVPAPGFPPILREQLFARLNKSAACPLTLLCAPAGSGKTTLLAGWLRQTGVRAAWLSLDPTDNSLERFLAYCISTLQSALPSVGARAWAQLEASGPLRVEDCLNSLINDLTEDAQPLFLVLDDYHLIQFEPIHAALRYLLEHQPANLHLILASRAEPPLPLGRLRLHHQLNEIREADLQFSHAETEQFFQRMGLHFSPAGLLWLEEKTEGWAAGLQLAALALQDKPQPEQFIRSFSGSHRLVLEYLLEDVLQQQSAEVQLFLLQTSILERLSAELCDALLQTKTSLQIMDQLEKNHLFLLALDDEHRWYRYHPLFAELLHYQLQRQMPDTLPGLQQRAAVWLEAHQQPEAAVSHWLAAQNTAAALRLIHSEGTRLLQTGLPRQALSWLNTLPPDLYAIDPQLHLLHAYNLISVGEFSKVEPHLQAVEASLPENPNAPALQTEMDAMRAVIAFSSGNFQAAIQTGQSALTRMTADHPLYSSVRFGMGVAYQLEGHLPLAATSFLEAARSAEAQHLGSLAVTAYTSLGDICVEQGRLRQAFETYQLCLPLAEVDTGGQTFTSLALAGLSGLYYQWNQLDQAVQMVQAALDSMGNWGAPAIQAATLARKALYLAARGQTQEAEAAITSASRLSPLFDSNPLFSQTLRVLQKQYRLCSGNLQQASRALEEQTPIPSASVLIAAQEELFDLSIRLQTQPQAAVSVLSSLEALLLACEAEGWQNLRVQALLQKSLALVELGQSSAALSVLEEVLAQTAAEGYLRLYLDQGPILAHLLQKLPAGHPQAMYCQKILAAFLGSQPPAAAGGAVHGLFEPLSPREQEVLQLLCEGLSNQKIAARLTLAPGTVKRHLHNIFGKMGVSTRAQAIARAHELNP